MPSVEMERLQPLPLVIKFWGQVFERRGEHNRLYGALLMQRNLRFVAGRDAGCVEHLRPATKRRFRCIRSEEHTSELQSLMRTSYAVYCWKYKKDHRVHNMRH